MSSNMSNFMPNFTTYTLHFDGSYTNQFPKSGAGCIIRDSKGELVVAASYNLGDTHEDSMNVAIAEATALLNGLELAQRFKIKLDFIKGDSQEVINHVLRQGSTRMRKPALSEIIEEIKALLQNINPFFKIEHISREDNRVANILARKGSKHISESRVYEREHELPAKAARFVREEKSLYGGDNGGNRNFITAIAGVSMLAAWGAFFGSGS